MYEIALPKMRKESAENIIDKEDKRAIAEQEYRIQAQQKIGVFIEDVVGTLRQKTMDLCNRISTNIKEGKVVKSKTLNSLKDFIDNFSEMNFVGDSKIEEELATLKKEFLDTHSTEAVVDEADLQEELRQRLESITKVAGDISDINSITGEYRRKISWE